MLLDGWDSEQVLQAIENPDGVYEGAYFTDEVLRSKECWRYICKVRGKNLESVDEFDWSYLSTRRGKLLWSK